MLQRAEEDYTESHGMTLEQVFKAALFEKIEDEKDAAVTEDAYEDYVKSEYQSRAIKKLWKEMGLDN